MIRDVTVAAMRSLLCELSRACPGADAIIASYRTVPLDGIAVNIALAGGFILGAHRVTDLYALRDAVLEHRLSWADVDGV